MMASFTRVSWKLAFHQSNRVNPIKRHVYIPVFFHVFVYSLLLRCTCKVYRLACGSEDVTQYNCLAKPWDFSATHCKNNARASWHPPLTSHDPFTSFARSLKTSILRTKSKPQWGVSDTHHLLEKLSPAGMGQFGDRSVNKTWHFW